MRDNIKTPGRPPIARHAPIPPRLSPYPVRAAVADLEAAVAEVAVAVAQACYLRRIRKRPCPPSPFCPAHTVHLRLQTSVTRMLMGRMDTPLSNWASKVVQVLASTYNSHPMLMIPCYPVSGGKHPSFSLFVPGQKTEMNVTSG